MYHELVELEEDHAGTGRIEWTIGTGRIEWTIVVKKNLFALELELLSRRIKNNLVKMLKRSTVWILIIFRIAMENNINAAMS